MYNIIWIIVIGFVAGIIARFLSPGPNRASGFILTTGLGIASALSLPSAHRIPTVGQPPTPARRRAAGSSGRAREVRPMGLQAFRRDHR
jgi:hypothetical protein